MDQQLTDWVSGPERSVECRILEAVGGSREDLGRLLEGCRHYLLLIAGEELPKSLRAKVGASDLVQETFIEAQQHFGQFQGRTEPDLLAWLRRILLHNIHDAIRRFERASKRRVSRERRLGKWATALDEARSSAKGEATASSADRAEASELLARAFGQLSDDHRRVIELRNLQLKSFAEIGNLMGRTPEATRKLWYRALDALQRHVGARNGH